MDLVVIIIGNQRHETSKEVADWLVDRHNLQRIPDPDVPGSTAYQLTGAIWFAPEVVALLNEEVPS